MSQAGSTTESQQLIGHLRRDPAFMPQDFGPQLAALIYLRWVDFMEAESEAIAAFDESEYEAVLPAALHWRTWHAYSPERLRELLGAALPGRLESLGNSRHSSLATHLHRIAEPVRKLGQLSPQSLMALVSWLSEQPFETPADRLELLAVFDDVLDRTEGKWTSEFRTPQAVVDMMIEVAAPLAGERIYDPCFGSAGFLTAACEHVRSLAGSGFGRQGGAPVSVSGVELTLNAFVIGLTRLALAGVAEPNVEHGNSLERPAAGSPHKEGFDLVIANPPFGGRIRREGLEHFPIPTSDTTGLFVQHALSQLRPDGRAVIAVPQGFLFRGGQEQRLREMLMERHGVEAIISLPAGTFMPYTGIQSSILVLRRKGPTERIRMIDAEGLVSPGKGKAPASVSPARAKELAALVHAPKPGKEAWDVDASSVADSDWDFTPKRRDKSGLWSVLDALRAELEVVTLQNISLILGGRSVKSGELTDEPSGDGAIPYIRIRDLQKGQVAKGSSWVRHDSDAQLDRQRKLRAGDVLLSKSGTIGKAAIVRNGAVGALVNSGLYIIQPDMAKVDPHYLVAYLSSSQCTSWLADRSRGATIQHLSKKIIEELPVPLPPLQVQQRVAEQHREHDVDVLAYLTQLMLEGEDDPVVSWLDGAHKRIMALPTGKKHELSAVLDLQLWGSGFTHVRNMAAHGRLESPLATWVLALSSALESLRDSGSIPPGPALYSLLQQAVQGLEGARKAITGHLPNENRAREMTETLSKRIKTAADSLIGDVRVVASCDKSTIPAGEIIDAEIWIHNRGSLPLRDVAIQTTPEWGAASLGFLAEKAESSLQVTGEAPRTPGALSLQIAWHAVAMDGRPLDGTTELAFEVVESQREDRVTFDLGASPYVCGDPITPEREDVFFGREELLEQIRRQIVQTGNVVLLEGNRRSGKTSLLKHLQGANRVPGWFGVYWSFQDAEGSDKGVGVETVEVFRAMARAIATALVALNAPIPLPNGDELPPGKGLGIAKACRAGISQESPFSDFQEYTQVILGFLAERDLGLLMMLDEFDKLQQGINSGVTSPQVPENLRHMLQHFPRFSGILTGSRRLKRLREEYWSALYGLGTRIGVTSLSLEAARQLITEPVQSRLTYANEATNAAIRMTAAQPFLLQCLCNRVFDMAAQLKTRSITVDIVQQAGNALVADNEHFASLWGYAGSDRRRYLLAFCHHSSTDPASLRLGVLQEQLLDVGLDVSDDDLIADLDFLRELELIELESDSAGDHYRLAIPLMGTWIDKQRDVEAVLVKARAETEESNG